jgi:hypothetical protein
MSANDKRGMTARQAKRLEFTIIGASLLALVFIFQPFTGTRLGLAVRRLSGGVMLLSRQSIDKNTRMCEQPGTCPKKAKSVRFQYQTGSVNHENP